MSPITMTLLSTVVVRVRDLSDRAAQSALFAYVAILLLQLKTIWGIWKYRDLTAGDTSYYFALAREWHENGRITLSWSPLYAFFYGSMLHISSNAFVVTTTHRVLILLVLAVLVLAVMRRLLPAPVAWMVTAWWVVLPIVFESMYEVHLFAIIPLLASYLAMLYSCTASARGAAIAILLASAVFVRNEHILAAAPFIAAVMLFEVWHHKNRPLESPTLRAYLRCYGLPLALVGALSVFFYSRAHDKLPALLGILKIKHTLNVCQVYAFGYQQRHPEWTGSPWTECESLMTPTFGKPQISLTEAVLRNPGAMKDHFLWNLTLIPNGVQVLLFNATSGRTNPDYAPVRKASTFALVCSLILAGVYLVGGWRLYRERNYWWAHWLRQRIWGWGVMVCPLGMVTFIMLTQRPRPSYLFSLSLFLMAATGFCIHVICHRWSLYRHLLRLSPLAMILAILMLRPYYRHATNPNPLAKSYRRLAASQEVIRNPDAVLLTPGYCSELCNYLGSGSTNCKGLDYWTLRSQVRAATDWPAILRQHGVNLVYIDESVLGDSAGPQNILAGKAPAWQVIAYQNTAVQKWMLLQKTTR